MEQFLVPIILLYITKALVIKRGYEVSTKKNTIFLIFSVYALFLASSYFKTKEKNSYEAIGISRQVDTGSLKEIYKKALKSKHPDKNLNVNAEDEFRNFKVKFDDIKNKENRVSYECFGTIKDQSIFTNSIQFYFFWLMTSSFVFLGKLHEAGKKLLLILFVLAVYEYYLTKILNNWFDFYILPIATFEQIALMKCMFPSILYIFAAILELEKYVRNKNLEDRIENLYNRGGSDLYQKISSNPPSIINDFIEKTRTKFKKKYSDNKFAIYAVIVFLILMK